MTIAALYVETDGCYFGLPNVEPWDEPRDARLYAGPHPVVAHPPCQRWGQMAIVNYARYGGEHNRPGNDGECFAAALNAVGLWCGVIEHPAKSRAWEHFGLTKPIAGGWTRCRRGGWTCEVWQSAYGHRANKATWLYYVGDAPPPELNWDRPRGSHQIGYHDQRGKERNKPTLSRREAERDTNRLPRPPHQHRIDRSAREDRSMTLTEPTKSSKAWERENAKVIANLKRTVPRGKRARAKLVAIAATVPLTDKQRAR